MNIHKNVPRLFALSWLLAQSISIASPTHVYVHNCTSLHFEVSITYEGTIKEENSFWQKGVDIITPYSIPEEKHMVLS